MKTICGIQNWIGETVHTFSYDEKTGTLLLDENPVGKFKTFEEAKYAAWSMWLLHDERLDLDE